MLVYCHKQHDGNHVWLIKLLVFNRKGVWFLWPVLRSADLHCCEVTDNASYIERRLNKM